HILNAMAKQSKNGNVIKIITEALEHLNYALTGKQWSDEKRKELYLLCADLNTRLVMLYEAHNDKQLALFHFIQAIENTTKITKSIQDTQLIESLLHYKNNDNTAYNKHTPLLL